MPVMATAPLIGCQAPQRFNTYLHASSSRNGLRIYTRLRNYKDNKQINNMPVTKPSVSHATVPSFTVETSLIGALQPVGHLTDSSYRGIKRRL